LILALSRQAVTKSLAVKVAAAARRSRAKVSTGPLGFIGFGMSGRSFSSL